MDIAMSKYDKILCAYCGSALILSEHGRCSFCNGPYAYVIVKEEKKFEIRPSMIGQTTEMDYSIDTFYSDLIKYNETGIIVGKTYTGKSSVLANFVNSIDDSLHKIVITSEPREFREVPHTKCGQFKNYTIEELQKADVVIIDDFDVIFRSTGGIASLAQVARERIELLERLNGKPLLLSVKNLFPYLKYRAKWIAELKDGSLKFKMIRGRRMKYGE